MPSEASDCNLRVVYRTGNAIPASRVLMREDTRAFRRDCVNAFRDCARVARSDSGEDALLERRVLHVVLVGVLLRELVDDVEALAVGVVDLHERLPLVR